MTAPIPQSLPLEVALRQALAHHQAGRLSEAEDLYRAILQAQPAHPDANHNLGVLAAQVGQQVAGLPYLKAALDANPAHEQYALSYAEALLVSGQAAEALSVLQAAMRRGVDTAAVQALRQRAEAAAPGAAAPSPADAPAPAEINRLIDLFNTGCHAELETRARLLVEKFPDSGLAWKMLGASLLVQGNVDLSALQKAAELLPDDAEAHGNLGVALKDLGQIDSAAESCRRALEISPDFAEAHYNLGIALNARGQFIDAAASYRRALEIKPELTDAHYNLGIALQALGQFDRAAASYRRALELKPDFAEAHSNLGIALRGLGHFEGAMASFRRALELNPDLAEAHSNLGNSLRELGRLDDAVASCRRALEIKPDLADAYCNLGNALRELGQIDDAAASYRMALEIKPGLAETYGNLLYLYAFTRTISPELECRLAADWERIALSESERSAAHNRAISSCDSYTRSPLEVRKLRIGVVSAELGQHAVAEFLEPFLEQIDRKRFCIALFPTAARPEPRAAHLGKLADEIKSLVGIPDKAAADLIRADRIDVLIDTTGHMQGSRLRIFAHRAAPVQCHYIGYHGTTGLTEMDWFIADENLLPSTCDMHFREDIWRLPRTWISYRGDASLPDSRWTPSPDGVVWLGSFNNLAKVREETLALWARVMHAIPLSRLFLKDSRSVGVSVQKRIREELCRHGIGRERVEFAGHVPEWNLHMALYDRLDIALDTIPLNSGTTAFDALWMGVPLVALEGNWMGGRMTSTILRSLGKLEWVAQNEDEYAAIVVALARDVVGRRSLRATQRTLMANSPLCDAKGLTRALEDAFERMFDLWTEKRGIIRHSSSR